MRKLSPIEKSDGVVNANKKKFERYLTEAERLLEILRNVNYRAGRLIEMVDDLSKHIAPVATCKKGCSHCCYQAVAISTWERDRIAKFSRRKHTGFEGYNIENGDQLSHIIDRFAKTPCPFLVNDACTVYPVRPFVCRTHFSMADDAIDCSLSDRPGGTVPYFNLEEFKTVMAWLCLQNNLAFADIRQFFGKE